MNKVKLLGIAPYEGMKELMGNIAARRSDVDLTVLVGDLAEGARIAAERQGQGYDAIVSRGGTAALLQRTAAIPIAEVRLSVYDVLRAIRLAQNCAGTFAIVGFASITKCARLLCDLLQYSIEVVTIACAEEVDPALERLKDRGCALVLGDMVTVTRANRLGVSGILITSGVESIEAAFDEAVKLCQGEAARKKNLAFLSQVLGGAGCSVVICDARGNRVLSTLEGESPRLWEALRAALPAVLQEGGQKLLRREREQLWSIEGKRLELDGESYGAFYFSRAYKPGLFCDQSFRLVGEEEIAGSAFHRFFSAGGPFCSLPETIERYGRTDFPVLILGEAGTGKDKAAGSLHGCSRLRRNPMLCIDCGLIDQKRWDTLLESSRSPFCDSGITIYLRDVGALCDPWQKQLIQYLGGTTLAKRCRLLFSWVLSPRRREGGALCRWLTDKLGCLLLRLPPLRQRAEDIPSLAGLYLGELGARLGKQVLGFSPEAMALLQACPWEQNLDQLRRVLRELVAACDSSYISTREVRDALLREQAQALPPGTGNAAPAGTLEEITRRAVRQVLEEEGMNQSRTAARLGISRSTLWRMLRE